MRRHRSIQAVIAALALLMVVPFVAAGQESDQRSELKHHIRELRERIVRLRGEQDYLLFRKTMAESDSKYLVIDSRARTGRLMFKNRVLKEFSYKYPANRAEHGIKPGLLTVAKKIEDKRKRNALVFGDALVVQWKLSAVPKGYASLPAIVVLKHDLLSLFYAVEEGSLAYVLH